MRQLLSLDQARRSPLLQGPFVSLSRPFRTGAPVADLAAEGLLHPHLEQRIPSDIEELYRHQEEAIRAIAGGRSTLISTGTGSGKTECFLYPIISRCLSLRDEGAPAGISAVIVYPMNALAEDQLMRLRSLLAGTGVSFGMYIGKTPEYESGVGGERLPPGASRADYEAKLKEVRANKSGESVCPAEEACSREAMRSPGGQPRILLTKCEAVGAAAHPPAGRRTVQRRPPRLPRLRRGPHVHRGDGGRDRVSDPPSASFLRSAGRGHGLRGRIGNHRRSGATERGPGRSPRGSSVCGRNP